MTRSPSSRPMLLTLVVLAGVACERRDGDPDVPDVVFGHCIYTNPFADQEECKELRGDGWTTDAAEASCAENDAVLEDGPCPYDEPTGACVLPSQDPDRVVQLVMPVGDCADNERGCELFGGGTFVAGPACGGEVDVDLDDRYDPDHYYVPETLQCVDPLPGEPPGAAEGGKVCTWTQMSGCTEEGRRFEDYASCEVVRTQRPYVPVPPNDSEPVEDPRMQDPDYAADVEWARAQVNACACVCCHKSSVAPEGASIFDTDAPGNWLNTFTEYGLAFGANAFDSSLLGRYEPSENNGFGRSISGLPSTDEERMQRIFQRELEHRGGSMSDWADTTPQPDIFYRQAIYEPQPCEDGEGIDADGVVTWRGGRARYLYVLREGAENPGNPPNRDKPEGTLWRIDTVPPAVPARTGEVVYGEVPAGHEQEVPGDGARPAPLVVGETYVLFAFADVGVPITRCTFTFPTP